MNKKVGNPKISREIFRGFALFSIFVFVNSYLSGKGDALVEDFKSPWFVAGIAVVIFLTLSGIYSENAKLNKAARHAFSAFLIAYLARAGMIFSVFVLIWLLVYFEYEGKEWT